MKQAPIIPLFKFQTEALPFKVQTIQNFIEEQDDINEIPHSHDYYEMIWMINGKGVLYADLQEHLIADNMIFCVKPGQPHRFQADTRMEGFVFSFTDSFFNVSEYDFDWTSQSSLFQLFSESPVIGIQYETQADIGEIALKMMKEFEKLYLFSEQLLKRYFKIFLIYLARQSDENFRAAEQTRETELVKSFMERLDKNFREQKMVAEYAAWLSVTPNYLNRIVKKNTGFSAGHQIRQRVVLEAKRMGRFSDACMKEIAYNLGFPDSAHFSKFFKTFSGANFTAFKKGGLTISFADSFNRA